MNLPHYLFIPSQSFLQGGGFILKTTAPYILGKLYLCENDGDIVFAMKKIGKVKYVKMDGYDIFIAFYGSFLQDDATGIETILNGMLAYYYSEKIETRQGKYKKYLTK